VSARSVIRIEVVHHDVLQYESEVLALKFAQASYGVDRKVVERVEKAGFHIAGKLPDIGEVLIVPTRGAAIAPEVLFVGVPPLGLFGYAEIRQFSQRVMRELAVSRPAVRYVAMTLHGRGFGLDEAEAFKAEVAGLLDAFEAEEFPAALEFVAIVENDERTADNLRDLLDQTLPTHRVIPGRSRQAQATLEARSALEDVGDASAGKPNVFVAMPFAPEFGDRFHYGIKNAVNAAGFLCERADLASFTGDVIAWVRDRIDKASLVIADLSAANPNVYLEVGYAWGRGVRTVLLAPNTADLKFDVRGQRCLVFNSIQHLEELLTNELVALRQAG
jgi:hypothetical protein